MNSKWATKTFRHYLIQFISFFIGIVLRIKTHLSSIVTQSSEYLFSYTSGYTLSFVATLITNYKIVYHSNITSRSLLPEQTNPISTIKIECYLALLIFSKITLDQKVICDRLLRGNRL